MRRRQPPAEHSEAVSRRLEALRAELHGLHQATGPEPTHTRVRGEVPAWTPPVVPVPTPGRHASRRSRMPSNLPRLPALAVTTGHAKVVAVLCAVALAGALWVVTADGSGPAAPTAPSPAAAPLVSTPLETSTDGRLAAAQEPTSVTVDVAGKVRRPQIVVLEAGSRVMDAIEAAGGSRRGVDLTPINLARVLVDGEQIVVGLPAGPLATTGVTPGAGGVALVNINTADQPTLETLPGVGPVTATSIIAWRTDHTSFSSIDELLEVDGIGEATLARLAPLVTV